MSDMWVTASASAELDNDQRKLALSRVACAQYWPFIAKATDDAELGYAQDLIADRVTAAVEPIATSPAEVAVLASKVMDTFTRDWHTYTASKTVTGALTRQHLNAIAQTLHAYVQGQGTKGSSGLSQHWANAMSQGNQYANPSRFADAVDRGTNGSVDNKMPHMTRQHFEHIANTIATGPPEHRQGLANHFAQALSSSNPQFNAATFIHRASGGKGKGPQPEKTATKPKYRAKDHWQTSCSKCGLDVEHRGKGVWHDRGGNTTCDSGGKHRPSNDWEPKTSTIQDAPAASAQMGWGYAADQQTNTAPETQAAQDAWEKANRQQRLDMGNGIGVSDSSAGPTTEGPDQNQGEDPLIMSTHADEAAGLEKGAYRIDAFGGLHLVSQKGASMADGYSDDPETLKRQKEHDERFQKRHTQEQVDRLHGADVEPKEASLQSQAVKTAHAMVDAMPREASLHAIEKEMRRRAAAFNLDQDETVLVVSAAMDRARSRLDFSQESEPVERSRFQRLLDKVTGAGKNSLLEECLICGKQIPKSEFDAHMQEEHPHDVKRPHRGNKMAAGSPDPQDPMSGGGAPSPDVDPSASNTDQNPDEGSGIQPGDNSASSGTAAPTDPSQAGSASQQGIQDDMQQPTTAASSPPRTKPATNPNAPDKPQQPMQMGVPMIAPSLPQGQPAGAQPLTQPQVMTSPQMMARRAAKIAEIADGVMDTNPGISEDVALRLASKTIDQFPSMIRTSYGGADWLHGDEAGTYTKCTQCGKQGFDSRTNHCHFCGYVNVGGTAVDASSAWDPISGKTTIRPGQRDLRNPGIN